MGTHIQRSALLPYPRDALYAIVADVERYPEFLPWVEAIDVLSVTEAEVRARVTARAAGMTARFVTANAMQPPERIGLALVEGPFNTFSGAWRFIDLSQDDLVGTKVELDLAFAFAAGNLMLRNTFGRVFERAASGMVDNFCQRAHALLGAPDEDA